MEGCPFLQTSSTDILISSVAENKYDENLGGWAIDSQVTGPLAGAGCGTG
jgi:hypothetical protein